MRCFSFKGHFPRMKPASSGRYQILNHVKRIPFSFSLILSHPVRFFSFAVIESGIPAKTSETLAHCVEKESANARPAQQQAGRAAVRWLGVGVSLHASCLRVSRLAWTTVRSPADSVLFLLPSCCCCCCCWCVGAEFCLSPSSSSRPRCVVHSPWSSSWRSHSVSRGTLRASESRGEATSRHEPHHSCTNGARTATIAPDHSPAGGGPHCRVEPSKFWPAEASRFARADKRAIDARR